MDFAGTRVGGEVVNEPPPRHADHRRPGWLRAAQAALSLGVVAAIFVLVLPQIASYSSVWQTLTTLGWPQVTVLAAVSIFNLFTYWAQMVAAMPGLTLAQAAVNNQSSTTVANIMPGGGAIAVGVAVAMFRSWGFTGPEIGLLISTTGVWNSFMKLALPVAALGLLAITGEATGALIAPAAAGLGILAGSLVLFALALWRPQFAQAMGNGLGRARSRLGRFLHRPPTKDWGNAAVRFRDQTIHLLARRWIPLTVTTVVSHLGLYAVLLVALRTLGVSAREVSWAQVLAVFAFARLLSAVPIPRRPRRRRAGIDRRHLRRRSRRRRRPRRRVPGAGHRSDAAVSHADVRHPDSPWGTDLPDLAAQAELAEIAVARSGPGSDRGGPVSHGALGRS